jgi:hypothetical protein
MKKRILIIAFLIILLAILLSLKTPKISDLGPMSQTQSWNITTNASSAGDVIIQTGNGVMATTSVIHAPYGVRSEVVTINGKTYATTTPLTEDDIKQMQKQQKDVEDRMNKIFEEQQKMFQEMWKNFPY